MSWDKMSRDKMSPDLDRQVYFGQVMSPHYSDQIAPIELFWTTKHENREVLSDDTAANFIAQGKSSLPFLATHQDEVGR